jgi:hypothetical protein
VNRFARSGFAVAVASLVAVVACGSRTGLLIPEPIPDASVDGPPGEEASADAGTDSAVDSPFDSPADAPIDSPIDSGPPIDASCTPLTCQQQGFNCGENSDGCGNAIQCGTCPEPQICGAAGFSKCGGGFGLGPDGAPICTPTTCAALKFNCGPAGDGCGGVLQCGTCQAPLVCGAAGTPGRCGSACFGLCQQQVQCESGTTSISGTVVAGTLPLYGTPDPVYNALVYVPNAAVQPFPPNVACSQCGGEVSGNPLVETQTAPDGTFTLLNMPAGANIPVVIQLGRWRRQITIPAVAPCTNTVLTADQTRLPRNKSEGDIPLTAIATGNADAIECVLMKMGVDQAEFTIPGGGGRVNMYTSNGSDDGPNTPPAENLWSNPAALALYDQILLPCEGSPLDKAASDQQNLIDYSNAGGRVFTTHYGYTWLYNDAPFSGTANWAPSTTYDNTQTGIIDTSTTTGQNLATWLGDVGALSGADQIALDATRFDVASVNPPSEQFIYATQPQTQTLQFDFYTPVGSPMAQQCGRVIFSDFHVIDLVQGMQPPPFPGECTMTPMTAQEKALEFMLFNLASCVPAAHGPCTPQTCADQGFNCGPQGDGCGNEIQCGTCTSPDTCGGGGVDGRCGYPDAGTCIPKTCAQLGENCGTDGDGCGNPIDCGTCTFPAVCGGGGQPNVCGI